MYPTLVVVFSVLVAASSYQYGNYQGPFLAEESTSYSFKVNPMFISPSVDNRRLNNFQSYQLSSSPKTFWTTTRPDAVELNKPPNFLENLLQQLRPSSQSIRPLFKTRVVVLTVTSTIVTPRIAACIPSFLFANSNPASCLAAQVRDDSIVESIVPTIVLRGKVETTASPQDSKSKAELESSIETGDLHEGRVNLLNTRRYVDTLTRYSTDVVMVLSSSDVTSTITPVAVPTANNIPGSLLCIPPGAFICK